MRDLVEAVVTAIKDSKKYGNTHEATIRQLAKTAVLQHKKLKPAVKAVRKQLHSIMAPYLGDPHYGQATEALTTVFQTGQQHEIEALCWQILHSHLSTQERLPIMADFYQQIFAVTGVPRTILDVACGLNPFALPWMGLTMPVDFYAYDIHDERIDFLNHFFQLQGLRPLAHLQDVAHSWPQARGDVALFLKEMPRFERNYHGRGRPLLEALQANYIVISFPTISTHGGRNLTNRYRQFFYKLVDGHDWPVTELLFESELVFCVQKGAG